MSISVDNLSLLAALTPLRIKSEYSDQRQHSVFSGKLDEALASGEKRISDHDKAKELAESLTLQMLQSSLTISGDSSAGEVSSAPSVRLPSLTTLLQTYASTTPKVVASNTPPRPAPETTQLQSLVVENAAPVSVSAGARSQGDTSWLEPLIAKASGKYGVDGSLIKAVIKAESDFNPHAVSHAGARGLMQLMPATARSLGVSDSFDPEQNVMAGTRFLKDMLRRYNGDVDSALAAYNWGPGNVDKRPDRLPRETRDYLVRVKQLYASYSS